MKINLDKKEKTEILDRLKSELEEGQVYIMTVMELIDKVKNNITIDGEDYFTIMDIFAVEIEWEVEE